MKFILEIDMDNAAFENYPAMELCALLKKTVKQVHEGDLRHGFTEGTLLDHNGNSTGAWKVYTDAH